TIGAEPLHERHRILRRRHEYTMTKPLKLELDSSQVRKVAPLVVAKKLNAHDLDHEIPGHPRAARNRLSGPRTEQPRHLLRRKAESRPNNADVAVREFLAGCDVTHRIDGAAEYRAALLHRGARLLATSQC